jgi:hypothetical protein
MNRFDDKMPPGKVFDNFQFVSFPDITKREATQAMQEEFFFQGYPSLMLLSIGELKDHTIYGRMTWI